MTSGVDKGPTPVFLISLPRSGSTLLQKMLAVSPRVATTAEPWICLPLATMLLPNTTVSEYWQATAHTMLEELIQELPGKHQEYRQRVADFVQGIYASIANDSKATVFLDKTPRYYLIVPFLAETFPDARFIFLFRNPLDVFASVLKIWHQDRINSEMGGSYVDLVRGPRMLAEAADLLGENALCLNYKQLVTEPETAMRQSCAYLDIPYDPAMLSEYKAVEFSGRAGDTIGIKAYDNVSAASVDKWKSAFCNVFRRWYIRRYVRFLGSHTLNAFGVDESRLLSEINDLPVTWKGALREAFGFGLFTVLRVVNHWSTGRAVLQRKRQRPWLPYG